MAVNIDTLEIEIGAESENAIKSIRALSAALGGLKRSLGGKWRNPIKDIFNDLGSQSAKINEATERVAKLADALNQLKSVKEIKIPKNLAERITSIGTAAQFVSPEAIERLKGMAEALSQLSGLDLRGLPAAMRAVARQPALTQPQESGTRDVGGTSQSAAEEQRVSRLATIWQGLRSVLSNVWQGLRNVASEAGKASLNVAKFIGNIAAAPLKRFAQNMSSAVTKLQMFGRAIGRIIFYRAIRAAIRMVTDSIREGINNLYQYSAAVGTTFKGAMDTIATAALYIKNSIGSMFGPLIEAVAPIIDVISDKIAALSDRIAQLMAALTGKDVYSRAIKYTTEYAEATNAAAKAVKGFLLPIDDLNVMSTNNGSGTADALDYSRMFEETTVSTPFTNLAETIRDAIEGGEWGELGALLGDKLNGLFNSFDAEAWGVALGQKIENAFTAIRGFLDTFSFAGVGAKIADFFNGIGEMIDFENVGRVLVQKTLALFDAAIGFIETLDWGLLAQNVSDFLLGSFGGLTDWINKYDWAKMGTNLGNSVLDTIRSVDWKGIARNISAFLVSAINAIRDFFANVNWFEVGDELFKAFDDLITNTDWDGLASGLFSLFGIAMGAAVSLVGGFVEGLWNEWIQPALDDLTNWWSSLWTEDGEFLWDEFLAGIKKGVLGTGDWLQKNVFEPFDKAFMETLGLTSDRPFTTEIGNQIGEGLLTGIGEMFSNIGRWIDENIFTPFVTWFKDLFGIHSPSTVMRDLGKDLMAGLYNGIDNMMKPIVNLFNGLWDGMKPIINVIIGGVEGFANAAVRAINTVINAMNTLSFEIPDWVPFVGGNRFGVNIPTVKEISIPRLAQGGALSAGQMFIAREAGPELVANIGNRTGVMNNDQIVDSVEGGVARANERVVSALYAVGEAIVDAIQNGGTLDEVMLAKAVNRGSMRLARMGGI